MALFQRSKDIIFLRDTARKIGFGVVRKDIRKAVITSLFQAAPIIKKHVPKESKYRVACQATRIIALTYLIAHVLKVPINNKAIVPFAIMVPIVDDLTDEEGKSLSRGDIEKCFMSPNGKLFCDLLYKTTQNVKNITKFEEYILKMGEIQSESKRQLNVRNGHRNGDIKKTLEKLSFEKGGYTGKLFLYLLKSNSTEEEEKAFYDLFSVIQLIDDVEDYKEDRRRGQSTLISEGYYTTDDVMGLIIDMEGEWLKIHNIDALYLTNMMKIYLYMASTGYNAIGTWLEHRSYMAKILLG